MRLRLTVLLLALALLLGPFAAPALAAAPEETPAPEAEETPAPEAEETPVPEAEESPAPEEEAEAERPASLPRFVDDGELTAVVEQALTEALAPARLSYVPFSVAVHFTRTGETWYYNADEWYYTASLYKLPMIMRFSRMAEDGELEDVMAVFRENVEFIKQRCLIYSDNSWAGALWRNVFTENGVMQRVALEYSHFPEDELPPEYQGNMLYSARFMLGIVREVYEHPEKYPKVLDYMCQAQPEQYFRHELEGRYRIAQKYGSAEGFNHTAGVIWTPSPILLVVMSNRLAVQLGDETIGHVAAAVAEYALLVDERADAWEAAEAERLAAERAAAEQAAAEAAAKAEAERIAAEKAAAEAAAATPAPTSAPEPAPASPGHPEAWALLLIPAAAAAWLLLRKKRQPAAAPSGDAEASPAPNAEK